MIAEILCTPTLFLSVVTTCRSTAQYRNQDTETLTVMQSRYRTFRSQERLMLPFHSHSPFPHTPPPPPLPLATMNPVQKFSKLLSAQAPGSSTPLPTPVRSCLLSWAPTALHILPPKPHLSHLQAEVGSSVSYGSCPGLRQHPWPGFSFQGHH